MADPDFDFDVPATEGSSVGGASAKRSGKSQASDGKPKICLFPGCDSDPKANRRHCGHHHRHLDNMRNQIMKEKGAESVKIWVEKCKDPDFANSQIEYMAKKCVGLAMFARAPLIDFVQWEQEFGVMVSTKSANQTQPFEEEQWILRQVNKFGRQREDMVVEWKQKLAGPWKRDYLGYKGALRLWLPAKEFEEKAETNFIKGASHEVSKQKKKPKQFETEAFRAHAKEAGFNHGHAFFGGHVDTGDDAEEECEAMEIQKLPEKGASVKRKACAETLDASEDEEEAATGKASQKPKKARKGGNGSGARAALFDALSKQLLAKHTSLVARKEEAEKAVKTEADAPRPEAATDVTTRKLYNEALDANLRMVKAWLDAKHLKECIVAFNKEVTDSGKADQVVDADAADTLTAQSPGFKWAVDAAGSSVSMARKHLLRPFAFMQEFVGGIPDGPVEEEALEKIRLAWRRMLACATQLESSIKKSSADVSRHVSGLAAATERRKKKEKDQQEKNAEAQHLAKEKEKAKKAVADGADLPHIFKLTGDSVSPVLVKETNNVQDSMDLSEPFVLSKSSLYAAWTNNATLLQVMTNFGARYKKSPSLDSTGKVAQPFATKQGKEPTEKFFGDAMMLVRKSIVDISEHTPNWMSTSWMFGLAPKRVFIGFAPNCAAMLRCLMYGEVEVFCLPVAKFVQAVKDKHPSVVQSGDSDFWTKLGLKPWFHNLKKEEIMFTPTGHMVIEKTGQASMIYGARKSFIIADKDAADNYTCCKDLMHKDGKDVERMDQVLQCLKGCSQAAAVPLTACKSEATHE
eukprot:g11031.t1